MTKALASFSPSTSVSVPRHAGVYLWLLLIAAVLIAGCMTAPDGSKHLTLNPFQWFSGMKGTPVPKGEWTATGSAQQLLWPLTFSGFICILAGVAWMVFFKDAKLLIVGILLALVPPAFMLIAKSFLIPVSIGVGVIGLVMLAALAGRKIGWWDWKKKTDEWAQNAMEQASKPETPHAEEQKLVAQAQVMRHVGKLDFDVEAPCKIATNGEPVA